MHEQMGMMLTMLSYWMYVGKSSAFFVWGKLSSISNKSAGGSDLTSPFRESKHTNQILCHRRRDLIQSLVGAPVATWKLCCPVYPASET